MNKEQRMVRTFHKRFNVAIATSPTFLSKKLFKLRKSLIYEEYKEFREAGLQNDLVKVADSLADLLYVVYGSAVTYGIDLEPVFKEVHRSNMSKGSPKVIRAPNGKILKAKNWKPPNLIPILARQQRRR